MNCIIHAPAACEMHIRNTKYTENECLQSVLALMNSALPIELIEKILLEKMPEILFSCLPPMHLKIPPQTWLGYFLSFITGGISSIAFNPNPAQHLFAAGMHEGIVNLYNTTTWETFGFFNVRYSVRYVTYSPDGKQIAVVTEPEIGIYDALTLNKIINLPIMSATSVLYNIEGNHIAITSDENPTVTIVDLRNSGEIYQEIDPGHWISALAYSPVINNRLAIKTLTGSVKIYNTTTGQILLERECKESESPKSELAYSPTGSLLAVGSGTTVLIMDVSEELIKAADIRLEIGEALTCLTYNLDGSQLAIGTKNGIRMYNTSSWTEIKVKSIPHINAHYLAYSSNSLAILDLNSKLYIRNDFPRFIGRGKGEMLLFWILYCSYTYKGQQISIQTLSNYVMSRSFQMNSGYWPTLLQIYSALDDRKKSLLKQCFGVIPT